MSSTGCNFNIFRIIHHVHGSNVVKIARNLEKKSVNIFKHKEHLTFNHTLKRAGVLPKSLLFNPPMKCNEGFKIASKLAGWSFLRLRIQHIAIKELLNWKNNETVMKTTRFSVMSSHTILTQLDKQQKKDINVG
jgi:hypothetical protein